MDQSLTALEVGALGSRCNVSDAHPRQTPTRSQSRILGDFEALARRARSTAHFRIEAEAHHNFFTALGQRRSPVGERVSSLYSSSIAIGLAAQLIASRGSRAAVLSPTFDNIPDLLKRHGLQLTPVSEEMLEVGEESQLIALVASVAAVFVTTPNNPTGWILGAEQLGRLAECCASRGTLLVLDASFRGFDPAAQYDCYAICEELGVDYIVIEDTGKLWPTQELKAGFLVSGEASADQVASSVNELLLSVSPVVLGLIATLSQDAMAGGFYAMHALIRENRARLARAIGAAGATVLAPSSRVSVALVGLPEGVPSQAVWKRLTEDDVHVLPAERFYWSDPAEGTSYLRVALARDPSVIATAGRSLANAVSSLEPSPDRRSRTPVSR